MNFKQLCKILIVVFFLVCNISYAQSQNNITLNFDNKSVKELLSSIEKQTPYTFVYNNSEINVNQNISISVKDSNLTYTLDKISDILNLEYQIIGRQILLKNKSEQSIYKPVRISGNVYTKKDSIPIPGVNIFVKGSSIGTITNMDGNFKLSIPGKDNILVFSFIGYKSFEINTNDQNTFDIFLEEENKLIDEIVVIGYGKESRKMLSSSVSKISSKEISKSITPNISESIKGKLPGLFVNQNSGTPGGAHTIRIRGISSISAGADPLYIIDGVPVIAMDLSQIYFNGQNVNTITDINTSDIESISILKDASASAIYGARGSNGVILITTKRGIKNESYIKFSARYGLQQVANTYEMLNAKQYMEYKNEAAVNDGELPIYSDEEIANNKIDTDWQSKLFKLAPIENYNLSFTNGNDKTFYYIVANYFNQKGIVKGTDYKRISTRINIDHAYSNKFKFGTSISLTRSINNRKEGDQSLNGPVPNAISLPPIYPIYNEDGTYFEDGPYANPISIANQHINTGYGWNNFGNIFASYNILKNLNYKFKYGINYFNFREHSYDPPTTRQGAKYDGLGIETTSEAIKTLLSNVINYSTSFNENHTINALIGHEIDKEQVNSTFMRGESFASEDLEYIISAVEKISADAVFQESIINSFFGRIKYRFSNKYILTLNARYDGSSRFGDSNKYGFFPSGDVAWRISDESFFAFNFINDLKIRTSYGVTGNDKIPDFLYISQFGTSEYGGSSAIYPINIASPDLKWETTKQFNIGIDFSVFNNRIIFTADYYRKKTEDLLLEKPTPPSSGFDSKISNIGKMENKGFEIYLSTLNIDRAIKWESQLNISINKNEVTQLYHNEPIENIGRGFQRIEVGEPLGIFYGYESLGVDPNTGDIVFADRNNDGIIDVKDKTKIGTPHAKFTGGFQNNFSFKNFSLDIFLQFSYGNDVFNGTRRYIESLKGVDNQTTSILDRWQEPGDETAIPRATNLDPNENNRVSSRFVEDGSYLKIKSVKLNYNVSHKLIERMNLKDMNFYILAQNLYTFTNYSGMDPEVNYAGDDVVRSGVEFFTYPSARVYSIGLSFKF